MILSDALILPVSLLQTQQVMTSRDTDISYSCAHFPVEIDEKSSLNGEFEYDLMMIRDSG